MKAIEYQKAMNNELAKRRPDFKIAYGLFVKMNNQRAVEGLSFLTMPNLERRYKALINAKAAKSK